MLVIRGNDDVLDAAKGGVLAIGNFDGVHRGHQVLLNCVRERAGILGTNSGVLVFEPHPREFFSPKTPHFRLTQLPEKLRLFEAQNLDMAVVLEFSDKLAGLTAEQFIQSVLVKRLEIAHVVVGYDFLFGKGRTGTPETLREQGKRFGFGVTVISAQTAGSTGTASEVNPVFSSTSIRESLRKGDPRAAASVLGHWWRVSGKVQKGAKVGRDLGFPTANIALPEGTELAHGIYAVRVYVDAKPMEGAAYFGTRPTTEGGGTPLLEVTIFDFDKQLYGRTIEIEFIDFIRGDETFKSLSDLSAQIADDCARARDVLRTAK